MLWATAVAHNSTLKRVLAYPVQILGLAGGAVYCRSSHSIASFGSVKTSALTPKSL
jgi:hypothetical protein